MWYVYIGFEVGEGTLVYHIKSWIIHSFMDQIKRPVHFISNHQSLHRFVTVSPVGSNLPSSSRLLYIVPEWRPRVISHLIPSVYPGFHPFTKEIVNEQDNTWLTSTTTTELVADLLPPPLKMTQAGLVVKIQAHRPIKPSQHDDLSRRWSQISIHWTRKRIVSYRLPHFAPAFLEMGGFRTFKNPSASFMTWESQTASGPMEFVPVPEMQFVDSEHYKKNWHPTSGNRAA